jgi:hypothetical protein
LAARFQFVVDVLGGDRQGVISGKCGIGVHALRKSIHRGLSGLGAALVAAYAIGNNVQVAKRGRGAADAVLIFGPNAAGVALDAH